MVTNPMISLMKKALVLMALVLAIGVGSGGTAVVAQEGEIAPEHLAAARKYVDLTDRVGIFEVTIVETAVNTARTILRTNPDLLDPVDAAITKAIDAYKGRKDELMNQFARLYAINFSVDELNEIVAFYESPVGVKLSTTNATLNQSQKTIMDVFQANLRTEFFAMVRANLKDAGYDV